MQCFQKIVSHLQCNKLPYIVTEFQPKGGGLSLAITDQGQTNTLNVTPSSYPTKFWGLFHRVATIAHTTEQTFLIGSFAKLEIFHWSRCCHQHLNQYALPLNQNSTMDNRFTYISNKHLTFHAWIFKHIISGLQHNRKNDYKK